MRLHQHLEQKETPNSVYVPPCLLTVVLYWDLFGPDTKEQKQTEHEHPRGVSTPVTLSVCAVWEIV